MTRLQASIKDSRVRAWRKKEQAIMFRIGSKFCTCAFCESKQLFRAYEPARAGFTYYCYDCSAKDVMCRPGANDIGQDAIRGSHSAIRDRKYDIARAAKLGIIDADE